MQLRDAVNVDGTGEFVKPAEHAYDDRLMRRASRRGTIEWSACNSSESRGGGGGLAAPRSTKIIALTLGPATMISAEPVAVLRLPGGVVLELSSVSPSWEVPFAWAGGRHPGLTFSMRGITRMREGGKI